MATGTLIYFTKQQKPTQKKKSTVMEWLRKGWPFPGEPAPENPPADASRNLAYLHAAQAALANEQKLTSDMVLIGVLSVRTPEAVWKYAVDRAVALTRREKS